jgi:hypothetical protein
MANDGLLGFRRTGGVRGAEIVPDLAASVPIPTDGGKTYTFRLRPGVRYSTGRGVQARDVRASIERVFAMKPESPGRGYYNGIVGAVSGRSLAQSPTCQLLPPNMAGYHRRFCKVDLAAARQLVRRSGTAGASVVVWSGGLFNKPARYLVGRLRELGYRATLRVVPLDRKTGIGPYFAKVGDSRTRAQAGVGGWAADFPSPTSFLRTLAAAARSCPRTR